MDPALWLRAQLKRVTLYADSYFRDRLLINTTNIPYSSKQNIPGIASEYYSKLPDNAVVVTHSMGGLVSREMVRQKGASYKVQGLITVGTPHIGAQAALLPGTNGPEVLFNVWIDNITKGPGRHGFGRSFAKLLIEGILNPTSRILTHLVNESFSQQYSGASVQDLKPGSTFLQALNSTPSSTLPAAHYAIWSVDDWNMHLRFADAMGDGLDQGSYAQVAAGITNLYQGLAFMTGSNAQWWLNRYYRTGDFNDYDRHLYWRYVSDGYWVGFLQLAVWMQADWDYLVTGALDPSKVTWKTDADIEGEWWASDGVVPYFSQAPNFISGTRQVRALHVNHLEQQKNRNSLDQIEFLLKQPDLGVRSR